MALVQGSMKEKLAWYELTHNGNDNGTDENLDDLLFLANKNICFSLIKGIVGFNW